jgi:hypothetical protein
MSLLKNYSIIFFNGRELETHDSIIHITFNFLRKEIKNWCLL